MLLANLIPLIFDTVPEIFKRLFACSQRCLTYQFTLNQSARTKNLAGFSHVGFHDGRATVGLNVHNPVMRES